MYVYFSHEDERKTLNLRWILMDMGVQGKILWRHWNVIEIIFSRFLIFIFIVEKKNNEINVLKYVNRKRVFGRNINKLSIFKRKKKIEIKNKYLR